MKKYVPTLFLLLGFVALSVPQTLLARDEVRVQINTLQGPTQTEIRHVPLEDYVPRVLNSEIPSDFPIEALKAQAILVRTKALLPKTPHRDEGFDFCDTTHCQVFTAHRPVATVHRVAASQTQAQVLSYRGKLIDVLYHSTCGGHTSANHRVFGGKPRPYLQGVEDKNYCEDSPHYHWEQNLSGNSLRDALGLNGEIQGVKITSQDNGGRSFEIQTKASSKDKWSTQDFLLAIGRKLGWNKIKSAKFKVTTLEEDFNFSGQGLGHGVGLCQWGTRGMALQGLNFSEILQFYFPGTRVQRVNP